MISFRVIDCETTGIPAHDVSHALCEVAYCDVRWNGVAGVIDHPRFWVVNPGRKIPPEAMAVHHITDEQASRGISPDIACARIAEGGHAYTVAHNADFDSHFVGSAVPWICTLKCAYRVWPDAPAHGNQVLRYHLGLDKRMHHPATLPSHRAGPDAYVTAHLLLAMLEAGTKVEDMVKWTKGHALLPKITFGKHRGMRWQDAPTDYLTWLRDKSDMTPDIKANARHWLKQREPRSAA
jgi:exodeoxyribonuclease X